MESKYTLSFDAGGVSVTFRTRPRKFLDGNVVLLEVTPRRNPLPTIIRLGRSRRTYHALGGTGGVINAGFRGVAQPEFNTKGLTFLEARGTWGEDGDGEFEYKRRIIPYSELIG
jgi:hypothetical protein